MGKGLAVSSTAAEVSQCSHDVIGRIFVGGRVKGRAHAHCGSYRQMSDRANMEVDVLVLCANDQQQQRNDENILATIEGDQLLVDEAMSELATAESATFDESRADDGEICCCDGTLTSQRDGGMLTPADDERSELAAPGEDNTEPFEDECTGPLDICISPAPLAYTMRSDTVEPQEEAVIDVAAVDRRNSDCTVDASTNDSVGDVDSVAVSASKSECDPSVPMDDVSVVTERHTQETVSNTRPQHGGLSETSDICCPETVSTTSVIDTCVAVDQSNVIDVDTLEVNEPGVESVENVVNAYSTDAVSLDNTQQTETNGLSDDAVALELAEAIDIDAKKKGFRVRFHEDHVVTGYHDPPMPWREGWPYILL